MHQIGVMPMPPASRMTASSLSAKLLRGVDLERLADAKLVRQREPPRLAGSRLMPSVALGLSRIDQRILPDQAVRQMQVDMGAGLVAGQRLAVGARQVVEVGVAPRSGSR